MLPYFAEPENIPPKVVGNLQTYCGLTSFVTTYRRQPKLFVLTESLNDGPQPVIVTTRPTTQTLIKGGRF